MPEKRAYHDDRRGQDSYAKRHKVERDGWTGQSQAPRRHYERDNRAGYHERSAPRDRPVIHQNGEARNEQRDGRATVDELNQRRPDTMHFTEPERYIPLQRIERNDDLPPLPEIQDPTLEARVFTHRSMVKGNMTEADSYENLELHGDAILELVATRIVLSRFPHLTVGQKSQLREALVRNDTLSKFSLGYGFDKRLRAVGTQRADPKHWQKILGDVFEAYIAAIDEADPHNGYSIIVDWMTRLWADILLHSKPANAAQKEDNSKVELQKLVVSPGIKLEYKEIRPRELNEKAGLYTFYMGVHLTGWGYENELLGSGEAPSLAEAKSAAATDALKDKHGIVEKAHQIKLKADEERRKLKEEKERLEKEQKEEKLLGQDS